MSDRSQQKIERHSNDPVREAFNRSLFEDRTAVGELGGSDLLMQVTLSKYGTPTLRVFAGGELVTYDDEVENMPNSEYEGGESHERQFENIHGAVRKFKRRVKEYDMEEKDV